jgi:predicted PurR-regulated permease PerM
MNHRLNVQLSTCLATRRAKPTVRGLSSREITTWINPLTRSVNGHGKLMEELINRQLRISLKGVEGGRYSGLVGLISGVFLDLGVSFLFSLFLFLCAC